MENLLTYHDNSYFNENDNFIIKHISLDKMMVVRAEFHKGEWYCIADLPSWDSEYIGPSEYKLSSIPTINFNEVYGKEVTFKDTELKGKLTKALEGNPGSLGVNWYSGQGKLHKKYFFPYFWNKPNQIIIK